MKSNEDVKFVRDVPTDQEEITIRKPFRIGRENKRRFVRLEISSPMSLRKIKDVAGGFWAEGDPHVIHGLILNISAGGTLVELDQAVHGGDVVSMHFTLQEVEGLENVLGLVKRVDAEPDCFIAGIEFISRDFLVDLFTEGEIELLADSHSSFDESVRQVLNKYVRREALAGENA